MGPAGLTRAVTEVMQVKMGLTMARGVYEVSSTTDLVVLIVLAIVILVGMVWWARRRRN